MATEADFRGHAGREFFTTRTVAEALAGFRPARRTGAETIPLGEALHRVPAAPVTSPHPLPGFARSTVDGYAVRAADTYGVSEGLPGYLDVAGVVQMGTEPGVTVGPGTVAVMPTGGVLPPGADAVVMVEYTQEAMPGTIEVTRPVAPGEGVVRADEDVAAGDELVAAGRPLRAQDLGMLAAAGVTQVSVHARPRVTVFSTGDEVVPPQTQELRPGQVRDADMIVVSAGSSVGARDETAAAVARLGPPGIWCHGLAIRPGKPTLLAECAGVPVIGLPGNPRSALVVFRLIGMPLVHRAGGCTSPPAEPVVRARLARDVASAAGRLDVVQVRLEDGLAVPLFGLSALLSILTAADGYVVVPEDATGLGSGTDVDVTLYC
jgi:molybdopterin molybdotransferase